MREINFYRLGSGRSPVEEFIDSLNPKQAKKVAWVMGLVEDLERVPVQYFEKMVNTDGLWEIRIQFAGDIFRFLGFFTDARFILVVHGFAKKTQKTPQSDIELAEGRKREYLSRKGA